MAQVLDRALGAPARRRCARRSSSRRVCRSSGRRCEPAAADERGRRGRSRRRCSRAWLEALDALAGARTAGVAGRGRPLGRRGRAGLPRWPPRRGTHGRRIGRLVVATPAVAARDDPDWATADAETAATSCTCRRWTRRTPARWSTALVGDALPAELVERIAERSDGNCLFIEELLRTWVSVGTLVPGDGGAGWRLAVPAEEIPLPTSVQSIYAAQLDDLPPDARRWPAARRLPAGASRCAPSPAGRAEARHGSAAAAATRAGRRARCRAALGRGIRLPPRPLARRRLRQPRAGRACPPPRPPRALAGGGRRRAQHRDRRDRSPATTRQRWRARRRWRREIDDGSDRAEVAGWRPSGTSAPARARSGAVGARLPRGSCFKRSIDLTPDERRLEKARRWERLGDATAFAADMDEGAAAYQKAIDFYREAIDQGLDRLRSRLEGAHQGVR